MGLYVASIGHEGSDAMATMVATNPEAIDEALSALEESERIDYRNVWCDETCDDDCEHMDRFEMWIAGPMEEKPLWVMHHVLGVRPSRRFRQLPTFMMDDLRAGEVVYAE